MKTHKYFLMMKDVVQLLLNREEVNPGEYGNYAACGAANNGFDAVVRLLLADPRVNAGEDTGYSICWTARYCRTEGQRECVMVR
jgi:hypothetical protein